MMGSQLPTVAAKREPGEVKAGVACQELLLAPEQPAPKGTAPPKGGPR